MKKIIIALLLGIFIGTPVLADMVGKTAPEIKAEKWINASGPVSIDEFKDKVLIVEFWATWCPPCREAIPHLVELYNKYKNKGLVVIGITNEKEGKIKNFIQKMKMDYIVGAGSKSGIDYNVRGIPHAFVIINKKIVWQGHPMGGLEQVVEKALEEKARKNEAIKKKDKPAENVKPEKIEKNYLLKNKL